jgi:N-methylhydantoinase A/acetophenone carboxylase
METPVYDQDRLLPGNEVIGPAILESEYTTVVIPPQMMYRVDAYGLGIMSAAKGEEVYADSHRRREAKVD